MSHSLPVKGKGASNALQPIFALPLESSLDLKAGSGSVTFTRASSATYVKDGIILTAAIDEPRFEANGLLIEGESENIIDYSYDFASWSLTNATITSGTTAPDGSTTACEISPTVDGNNTYITTSITGTPNTGTHTFSIYVKFDSFIAGSGMFYMFRNSANTSSIRWSVDFDNDIPEFDAGVITGTDLSNPSAGYDVDTVNGFYRLWFTFDIDVATSSMRSEVWFGNWGASSASDGNLYLWGAQLEEQPAATSYIPTAGAAVTREPEYCYLTAAGNHPPIDAGSPFSVHVKFDCDSVAFVGERLVYTLGYSETGINDYSMLRFSSGSDSLTYFRSGSGDSVATSPDMSILRSSTITVAADETTTTYFDGVQQTQAVRSLQDATGVMASSIYIGTRTGSTGRLSGHINSLKIFNKALSADEVAAL
jgi:hypothetical protein